MKKKADFSGAGFDKGDFAEQERAIIRERGKHYDENFLSVDAFLVETGLVHLVNMIKGVKSFAITAGVIMSAFGAIAYFQGWF